jgi:hypothetical protein
LIRSAIGLLGGASGFRIFVWHSHLQLGGSGG